MYSLFTLRQPHSPQILNGEWGFLKVNWRSKGLIFLYCQSTFFQKRIDFKVYRQFLHTIIASEQNLLTLGN